VVEKQSTKGQPELVKELQDTNAVVDSMVLCRFSALPLLGPFSFWDHLARAYSLATGVSVGEGGLRLIGERIYCLTRSFNVRQGLRRRDDMIPERWIKDPLATGVSQGKVVPEAEFNQMLDRYYELRGWDKEGVPKPEKLRELGVGGIREVGGKGRCWS
jgi:aldehyde:ferredoxin oxidoreductase